MSTPDHQTVRHWRAVRDSRYRMILLQWTQWEAEQQRLLKLQHLVNIIVIGVIDMKGSW